MLRVRMTNLGRARRRAGNSKDEMQVLRLRCPFGVLRVRMTNLRRVRRRTGNSKDEMQVLRLRCASLRMTTFIGLYTFKA
jgi:hypothetical protein